MASTVVSSASDTSGNGGRKIVSLPNGNLVSIANNGATTFVYRSQDKGTTWPQLCSISNSHFAAAITNIGNSCTVVYYDNSSTSIVYSVTFDATTVTNTDQNANKKTVDTQTTVYNVSVTSDGAGALHAVWESRNTSYPNCNNLRYSKSTDGGATWAFPTQISTFNTSGLYASNPTIFVRSNNNPVILCQWHGGSYQIASLIFNTTSWGSANVYDGITYSQSSPSVAVDSNDVIHAVWSGSDGTDTGQNNIRYSKSTDGGVVWSTPTKLTSGNVANQELPSIAIDPNKNDLYVFFDGQATTSTQPYNIKKIIYTVSSGTWGSVTTLTNNASGNSKNVSSLWSKFNMNSVDAIRFIYQDPTVVTYDSIDINQPPLAPTLTQEPNFDASTAQTLAWTFNDTPNDAQSAYQLEIYDTANTATPVISVPKTTSMSSTYALAANALTNGKTYQWRVLTYDAVGAVSPWSTYSTFKCSATPTNTVTDPVASATITTPSYTFKGSYTQANGVAQQSFHFKLWDSTGATVLQDSGTIIGTTNQVTIANLSNNTSYKIEFIATSQDGITGSSGKVAFSVVYTPPATPTGVTATNDATNARVIVAFTNPSGTPTASSNNVYYRKQGDVTWKLRKQGAISPYYDYLCPVGNFEYSVTAITANGAVSVNSTTAQVVSSFNGEWVIDEQTPSNNVRFYYNFTNPHIKTNQQRAVVETFAVFPFIRKGLSRYHGGVLQALYLKQDADLLTQLNAIDAMTKTDNNYILKMMNGLIYRVSLSAPSDINTQSGNSLGELTVEWTEVGYV